MPIEKIVTPDSYVWGARHTKKGWHVSLARQSAKRWVQYPIQGLILESIVDVHRMFPGRTVVASHYKCDCVPGNEPLFVDHLNEQLKPVPMPSQPLMPPHDYSQPSPYPFSSEKGL
jgi:hypothetical protein